MRSRSLRVRLFVVYATVMLATLAATIAIESRVQNAWMLEHSSRVLERTARDLEQFLANDLDSRRDGIAAGVRDADAVSGYRITLIGRDGRVLADSRANAAAMDNHAQRPEVRAALEGRTGIAVRRSRTLGIDLQYVAVPAPPGAGYAVMRVAVPLAMLRGLNRALVGMALVAGAVALVVLFALFYWLNSRHASRIEGLQEVARRIGAGDDDARAPEEPDDEVGRLGAELNGMAAELRARLRLLERERDEREHILAHMSDGVALLDGADRIVHCNHSLAALLGAPRPATPGTPFADFMRVPEIGDLLARARTEGRSAEADLRLWAPEARAVHARATALDRASGAVLLVLHDLTEAETVNRIRQDFVANVSHELRTPLTSLYGYAETLLDGGLEDAENRERFVRVIRDQAGRLQALVDDLLSLAQLERPEASMQRERFDLRALVRQQAQSFGARVVRSGLTLEVEDGGVEWIVADRARLEQVVANLIDNALKYTEAGGVRIRMGGSSTSVWCEVSDTGCGIPAEHLPRVFERFYRVDKARSRERGGTGLGLSIVKHVVALHGGEVSVASVVGEGSTFRFELPRV